MELRQLATFVMVVREGTLSAAARALTYSQAAVTLHIQQLERELGARLFDRVGKSVRITPAGRRAHARALQILEAAEEMRREAAAIDAGDAGQVALGCIEPTASVRLPRALARLWTAYPKIEVRVEVGGTTSTSERVAAGGLDLGIASRPPAGLPLTFEPLFQERLVVVVSAARARKLRAPLRARDLSDAGVVLTEHGCAYRRAVEEAFAARGAHLRISLEMGSTAALLGCVREGLGAAIVPAAALRHQGKGLAVREIADLPMSIAVGLVARAQIGDASGAVRIVREHLRARLREAGAKRQGRDPKSQARRTRPLRGGPDHDRVFVEP
jgi:DNA-binding transcriptional LysR family regulator